MFKLKILFQQVLMISTGILVMTGINGVVSHLTGTDYIFEWYYPISFLLLGFLCALPTTFFILDADRRKLRFIWNLLLHFLSILAIVSMIGYVFHWYFTLGEFIQIVIEYLAVYIFVWVTTLWFIRVEDEKINQALKNIQDEE